VLVFFLARAASFLSSLTEKVGEQSPASRGNADGDAKSLGTFLLRKVWVSWF